VIDSIRHAMCLGAFLALVVATGLARAEADSVDQRECARAYEAAQEHRLANRLLASRAQLLICRQESCKGFISRACSDWFTEINASVCTVTFDVRRGAQPVAEFQVLEHGTQFTVRADGDPVETDPGEHLFELAVPGESPIQRRVTLQPGERNRLVRVLLEAPTTAPTSLSTELAPERSAWPYVLVGIGGLGLSGFAVLGGWGLSRENDLRNRCAPNCNRADVSSVRAQYLAADIAFGIGAVALAAGTYWWFSDREPSNRSVAGSWRFALTPYPLGGAAQLERSF